jgi:hypothetical protein
MHVRIQAIHARYQQSSYTLSKRAVTQLKSIRVLTCTLACRRICLPGSGPPQRRHQHVLHQPMLSRCGPLARGFAVYGRTLLCSTKTSSGYCLYILREYDGGGRPCQNSIDPRCSITNAFAELKCASYGHCTGGRVCYRFRESHMCGDTEGWCIYEPSYYTIPARAAGEGSDMTLATISLGSFEYFARGYVWT